jgi:hypothetical protein
VPRKPRLARPVYPVKYLDGKELATKYMRGYVWTNILGTSYLFNRVKCEAYCVLLKTRALYGIAKGNMSTFVLPLFHGW